MKIARFYLLLIAAAMAVMILSSSSPTRFRAQTGKSKNAPCCGAQGAIGPRELDFPYYSLRDGFNSTLYLVSDSPTDIPLTIIIHNLAGQAVFATPTLPARQRLTFDLRALLTAQGADPTGSFAEGSVQVLFTGTIMPVVGQITISNPVTHLVHESEMAENDPGRSDIPTVQNGLWWGLSGGRDALIMVSNTKGQSVVADVFLEFQGKTHQVSQTGVAFMAHETKVLSVTDMLNQLGFSSAQVPEGGITIIARGGVGGLMAQGKILDPVTGFSTTLRFPSPDAQISNALHAVGIPIGKPTKDSPFVGMGTFIPRAVVRNLTGSDQQVTLTIEYPKGVLEEKAKKIKDPKTGTESYWEFDGESGQSTGQLSLPPVTVPAYATQEISLLSALGELPLPIAYASVRIQYTGAPGGVIAELASVDDAQDLVVDSHVVNEGYGWMGSGANPWHLDDQTESILFLTDMGDRPVGMGFYAMAGGIQQLLTELKLQPHETRAINLRQLRDTQRPDFKGHMIPAAATDGTVTWARIGNQPVAGRVLTINRKTGLASNYDCCYCPCPLWYYDGEMYVWPSYQIMLVNGNTGFEALADFYDCNDNGPYTFDVASDSQWSSDNTNIATVNGGDVTGVGAGTTYVTADYTGCMDWEPDGYGGCYCDSEAESSDSGEVEVGDGTPVIYSISNTEWPVGATTSGVVISGEYFGTNPVVNFSDSAVTCSLVSASDTQITCNIYVGSSASGGEVDVTITSQGYNGSGFLAMPNGASQAQSKSKPANKQRPTFLQVWVRSQTTRCLDQECGERYVKHRFYSGAGDARLSGVAEFC
jgi:hypothetical protein